jgi:hypothetical protein
LPCGGAALLVRDDEVLGSQLNVSFYFVFVLLKDACKSAFALQVFGGLCDGLFGESLDTVD